MGKISSIFIFLLMVNVIGYILLADYASTNQWAGSVSQQLIRGDNPLLSLYSQSTDVNGNLQLNVDNTSGLFQSVPTTPPTNFVQGTAVFIDRIFILFGFVRAILGVALFPVTLLSILALPWQLSLLLAVPLSALYILGLIDLFSGGNS